MAFFGRKAGFIEKLSALGANLDRHVVDQENCILCFRSNL